MPRLIWSPEAIADVQRLYRFLAQKNPDAARRAISAIRSGMNILADHPDAGRPAGNMDPDFREWPISFGASGYVALYRVDGIVAIVLAVRHQSDAGS